MTLREQIQKRIEKHSGNAAEAAVSVCLLLESRIDLSGNGWFDDDPVMDAAFDGKEYQEILSEVYSGK